MNTSIAWKKVLGVGFVLLLALCTAALGEEKSAGPPVASLGIVAVGAIVGITVGRRLGKQ